MAYLIDKTYTANALIIVSALLVSACSSSSDSALSIDNEIIGVTGNPFLVDDSASNNETGQQTQVTDNSAGNGSGLGVDDDNTSITSESDGSEDDGSNENDTSLVTPDPLAQTLTQVTFDITVPAYSSNTLMVDLIWGDYYLLVGWVGDEFWSASIDLPANTENQLIANFYDNNGRTALGTAELSFKTGTDAAESLQITADQFDTEQWDADFDGVSNLDESIAGTNPLLDDTVQLEIRPSLNFSRIGFYSVSSFEPSVPADRPYFFHEENDTGSWTYPGGPIIPGDITITTVDIDETGSGTYFYENIDHAISDSTTVRHRGTRTTGENSVAWEGSRYWSNQDSGKSETNRFNFEFSLLSDERRTFTGGLTLPNSIFSGNNPQVFTFSLVGELIEGTQRCAPVSGTATLDVGSRSYRVDPVIYTATKTTEDQYWTVNSTTDSADGPIEEEYLVQSIGTTFLCIFSDWE